MTTPPHLDRRTFAIAAASAALVAPLALPSARADARPAPAPAGTPTFDPAEKRTLTVLVYPGMTTLDAIGPYEMLNRVPGIELAFAAEEPGLNVSDTGKVKLMVDRGIADIEHTDVLLVPGGDVRVAQRNPVLLDWIRKIDETSTYTCSVCTGALILGGAGLLNGRRATTHWAAKSELAGYGAEYVAERYVRSDKYWTAAGISAGMDLALALIDDLAGPMRAQMIQLGVEYQPDPPFHSGSESTAPPDVLAAVRREFENG